MIIAATQGHDKAIKALTEMYKCRAGLVSRRTLLQIFVRTRPVWYNQESAVGRSFGKD